MLKYLTYLRQLHSTKVTELTSESTSLESFETSSIMSDRQLSESSIQFHSAIRLTSSSQLSCKVDSYRENLIHLTPNLILDNPVYLTKLEGVRDSVPKIRNKSIDHFYSLGKYNHSDIYINNNRNLQTQKSI